MLSDLSKPESVFEDTLKSIFEKQKQLRFDGEWKKEYGRTVAMSYLSALIIIRFQ